jgi:hypothetical protein
MGIPGQGIPLQASVKLYWTRMNTDEHGIKNRTHKTEFKSQNYGMKDFFNFGSWHLNSIYIFLSVFIRVHPRPIKSFVFRSLMHIKSLFICIPFLQFLKILLRKNVGAAPYGRPHDGQPQGVAPTIDE